MRSMQSIGAMLGMAAVLSWVDLSIGAPAEPLPARTTFRFMTYNIHHGEGVDGTVDLPRLARLIQEERADVVALQEVDRNVRRTQGIDMPARLAELTGLTCVFSNNLSYGGGEYGNAILTRFPVRSWTNEHLTKLGAVEQRGLLQATIEIQGTLIRVACTHLDSSRENAERLHQVSQLKELLSNGTPLLLGGDFNATPQSMVHRQLQEKWIDLWPLVSEGPGHTIPAQDPTRRIDYVWIEPNSVLRPKRAWVPQSLASDHLPIIIEFRL